MAEKQEIIIEVEIDNKAALKNAAELNKKLFEQREKLKTLNKTIKDSNTITEEQAAEQNRLKRVIAETSKELRREQNILSATKNSKAALEAETSKLIARQKQLDTSIESQAQEFKELQHQIANNTNQLKEIEEAQENYRRNVGNYSQSIKEALGDTQIFGTSLNGVNDAFKSTKAGIVSVVKQLFTLKGAIAATGIGALVLILGSLITFFTKTRKGAKLLEQAFGFLGGIVGKLIGDFAKLGEIIFETFTGQNNVIKDFIKTGEELIDTLITPFKDFPKTLELIGKAILDNIINRFKSVLVLGEAIEKLIALDFEGATKTAADAFIQFGTGVENGTDKIIKATGDIIDGVKEVGEGMLNGAKAVGNYGSSLFDAGVQGARLAKNNIALRDSIRASTIAAAEAERQAEKLRKQRDDETLSIDKRRQANKLAIEQEKTRRDELKKVTNARLGLLENERKLGKKLTDEQLDEQANLKKELADIETDFLTRTTELQNEGIVLNRDFANQQAQIEVDKQNAILVAQEEGTKKQLDAQIKALEAQRDADIVAVEGEIANLEARNAKIALINAQFRADEKAAKEEFAIEEQEKENEFRIKQLENDLQFLELSGMERLAKQQEILNLQREQELANTTLTEEQRAEIIREFEEKSKELTELNEQSKLETAEATFNALAGLAKEGSIAQKAFAISAATINTILAVQNALATVIPYPSAVIAAASAGITGAANVAKIAGVKFEKGGSLAGVGGTEGTRQQGKTDNLLGFSNNIGVFRFGGEEFITNKRATQNNMSALETINRFGANTKFTVTPSMRQFQDGGALAGAAAAPVNIEGQIRKAFANAPEVIVKVSDIETGFSNVAVSELDATI